MTPGSFTFSFTYHLYTLLDLYYYYIFTGDTEYLRKYWDQYKLALDWSLGTIDSTLLANVTSTNDWLRSGMGGHNVEVQLQSIVIRRNRLTSFKANAILYHTLDMSLTLAKAVKDESVSAKYSSAMAGIEQAVNQRLWDPNQNLFYDNDTIQDTDSVHPQDGNSWAVIAGIVDSSRSMAISESLKARWIRPYGAPAPEAGPTISPFATGFEIQAHFIAGHPQYAIELMEFMYADFMLDDSRMTNSSFIEGYSTNGDLHYAPYDNDARISYAHGWATGSTSALTFYAAGLRLNSGAGQDWTIQPRLGDLSNIDAGFETPLGEFSVKWNVSHDGVLSGQIDVPQTTSGTLILPQLSTVVGPQGELYGSSQPDGTVVFENVPGNSYRICA